MENKENQLSALQQLRKDVAKKQKKGLHFIAASVFIWIAILCIQASSMPVTTKNLYTFFCSAPLVPLAYFISRLIRVEFRDKNNPLSSLGFLFTMNQVLYILISMWVYAAVPDKFLMVYAMIFGAHLLPYGWLYQSVTYYVISVIISIVVLILGLCGSPIIVAVFMIIAEVIFCCCLIIENKIAEQHEVFSAI